MYEYFVSYASDYFFGSSQYISENRVESWADIETMRQLVNRDVGREVVILNFILLGRRNGDA
jgi:hypothetical protein